MSMLRTKSLYIGPVLATMAFMSVCGMSSISPAKSFNTHAQASPQSSQLKLPFIPADDTFYLKGRITDVSISKLSYQLWEEVFKGRKTPLNLVIDSEGGDVEAGWQLRNTIELLPIPVNMYCIQAQSMAAVLFYSHTKGKRVATPQCKLMTHAAYLVYKEKNKVVKIVKLDTPTITTAERNELIKDRSKFARLFGKVSGVSVTDALKFFHASKDRVITLAEAQQYNLVDIIINDHPSKRLVKAFEFTGLGITLVSPTQSYPLDRKSQFSVMPQFPIQPFSYPSIELKTP